MSAPPNVAGGVAEEPKSPVPVAVVAAAAAADPEPLEKAAATAEEEERLAKLVERALEAASSGSLSEIKKCHALGLDWKGAVTSENSATALHLACFGGHLAAAAWLKAHLPVETKDATGGKEARFSCLSVLGTPFHAAAFAGQLEAVKWLSSVGAVIGACDANDATPLHHACLGGHPAVVRWLLWHGADAKATTKDGLDVTAFARDAGQLTCATVVEHHEKKSQRDAKRQKVVTPAAAAYPPPPPAAYTQPVAYRPSGGYYANPMQMMPPPGYIPAPPPRQQQYAAPPYARPDGALARQLAASQPQHPGMMHPGMMQPHPGMMMQQHYQPYFYTPMPGPPMPHYAPPPPAAPPPPPAVDPATQSATLKSMGKTPTQTFQSYVPVSAKAQYEAARDYMAETAMKKMGRKGIAKRVPTWLQSNDLE